MSFYLQRRNTTNKHIIPHEKLLGIRRVSNPSTSIDPGSESLRIGFLVLIQNAGFVRDNSTNYTKEGHKGRKRISKKLLDGNEFL